MCYKSSSTGYIGCNFFQINQDIVYKIKELTCFYSIQNSKKIKHLHKIQTKYASTVSFVEIKNIPACNNRMIKEDAQECLPDF